VGLGVGLGVGFGVGVRVRVRVRLRISVRFGFSFGVMSCHTGHPGEPPIPSYGTTSATEPLASSKLGLGLGLGLD